MHHFTKVTAILTIRLLSIPCCAARPNSKNNILNIITPPLKIAVNIYETHIYPALREPNKRILLPIKNELKESWKKQQSKTKKVSNGDKIVQSFQLSILAFASAEILSYCGVFADDDDHERAQHIRKRAIACWEATKKWCHDSMHHSSSLNPINIQKGIKKTIDYRGRNLAQKLNNCPDKTKFALGATVGLISSRALVRASYKIIKIVGVAYIVLELGSQVNVIGGKDSMVNKISYDMAPILGDALRNIDDQTVDIRLCVRDFFTRDSLKQLLDDILEENAATVLGLGAGIVIGYTL